MKSLEELLSWEDIEKLGTPVSLKVLPIVSHVISETFKSKRDKKQFIEELQEEILRVAKDIEGLPKSFKDVPVELAISDYSKKIEPNMLYIYITLIAKYDPKKLKSSQEDLYTLTKEIEKLPEEEAKEKLINKLKEIKNKLNTTIREYGNEYEIRINGMNGTKEEKRNYLIQLRNEVVWYIRNYDLIKENLKNVDLSNILKHISKDKFLLFLNMVALSSVQDAIHEGFEIDIKSINYVNIYSKLIELLEKEYNEDYIEHIKVIGKDNISSIIDSQAIKKGIRKFYEYNEDYIKYDIKDEDSEKIVKENYRSVYKKIKKERFEDEIKLNWELIPVVEKDKHNNTHTIKINHKTEQEIKELEERKEELLSSKTEFFSQTEFIGSLKGINNFEGYVGYIYPNRKVIFEKFYKKNKYGIIPTINEAIYVMNLDNFIEMSKISKSDIIEYISNPENKDLKRIYHSKNWKQKVLAEINGGYTEDLIDYMDEILDTVKTKVNKEKTY